MNDILPGARAILLDIASTLFFLAVYALTGNLLLSVGLGVALAIGQIALRLWRRERVDALQWISLVIIVGGSGATLLTQDARFLMLKPSIIYALIGASMLQRGWIHRYMSPRAVQFVPDLIIASGYAWAALMFLSAALNIFMALTLSLTVWGAAMSAWAIGSKALLFVVQVAVMKTIGRRRARSSERRPDHPVTPPSIPHGEASGRVACL